MNKSERFTKARAEYTYVVIGPWGEEANFQRKAEAEAWITDKLRERPEYPADRYRLFAELSFTVKSPVEGSPS